MEVGGGLCVWILGLIGLECLSMRLMCDGNSECLMVVGFVY